MLLFSPKKIISKDEKSVMFVQSESFFIADMFQMHRVRLYNNYYLKSLPVFVFRHSQ